MKTRISIDNLNREIAERKRTEELLRQSEERLRMAMEAAKVGTWRWDPATNMDTRDASFNRMLGLEPSASTQPVEEFIGFVYPEDRRGVEDAIRKAVRERGQYSAEFRIVRPDGEVCWLSDRGRVICDEAGEVRYMTGAVVDITERKKAEETLRESEERFHIAAETSNDIVYESDMQHSIQWFGKIDEMLGYGPGEFPRTMEAWADSIHPQDRERVMAAVQAYLDERLPYVIEYRIRRKDGAYQWWAARGAATRTPDGHPVRWIGTITDITERKRAEEKLTESEQRFKTIFDNAADGILLADVETKKFYIGNKEICRMLGYKPEEI
jgi:PAS domain S-box-containing protein